MPALPRLHSLASWLAIAVAVASCHSSFHPLQVAEGCRCSPSQYCHVRPAGSPASRGPGIPATTVECLPFPASCASAPTCACLGRAIDACREELGAFTVLEPRSVGACGECSAEEYCWSDAPTAPMCGLIPARCEETPTCDCFLEARHGLGRLACDEREGRIQAGPLRPAQGAHPAHLE
jgi:hypothetical protein